MAVYELVPKTYIVSCTVQIIGVNFVIESLSNAPNKITKLKRACTNLLSYSETLFKILSIVNA